MKAMTEEIEAAVGTALVPTAVTIEIVGRSRARSRLRGRETVRIALTYSLERSEDSTWDAINLAWHIRRSVRLTRNAYGLARMPPNQRPPVSLHVAPNEAALSTAEQEPTNGMVSGAVSTSILGDESLADKEAKQDDPTQTHLLANSRDSLFQSAKIKEVKAARKLTQTQQRTLEIMARQLGLEGQGLVDLLGLRCNKTCWDDLTYREAAGLIATFSGQLRQRLQRDKENEANINRPNQ